MNLGDVRVAIIFKDFANWTGLSHIGLNVAALTNARVLDQHGIHTTVFPVRHNIDVVNSIFEYEREHRKPLTHVIISAPWMSRHDMKTLIEYFPYIQFVVECHSNIGFLQADPNAVEIIRAVIALSFTHPNIVLAGNSKPFVEWASKVYGAKVVLLPNLYPITKPKKKRWKGTLPIKIGVFGAVRPQKNFMTAAAAAMLIQNQLQLPVELHMSDGGEGDGGSVSRAIDQMVRGVPSVVSQAIRWAPNSWKADSDDVLDVAAKGVKLLCSHFSVWKGLQALRRSNAFALEHWLKYLEFGTRQPHWWEFSSI